MANILFITRNLPPLIGGMERLLHQSITALAQNNEITVIGPKGCSSHLDIDDNANIIEAPESLARFIFFATLSAIKISRKNHFDLVIGGSGLMAPTLLLLQKTFGIPTTCFVHGLDIVVHNFIYQSIFTPSLKHLKGIISNSQNTKELCIRAGLNRSAITVINPGCEVPEPLEQELIHQFKLDYNTKDSFTILFVGRIAPRKGLLQFINNGFENLLKLRPESKLLIIGDTPEDSLAHQGVDLKRTQQLIQQNNWENKINFLGSVSNDTLAQAYSSADCLIFPLVNTPGDVEGFGMVAIEAAAYGTPTVAFDEGGVKDAVENNQSGYLIQPEKYTDMVEKLAKLKKTQSLAKQCRYHAKKFSWDIFNTKLNDHTYSMINNYHTKIK